MATNSSSSGYWVGHKSSKESQNGSWLYHQASSNSRPSSQYTYVNSDQLSLRSSISKENNSSISNRTAAAPQQQRATKHASVLLEETSACLRSIPLIQIQTLMLCALRYTCPTLMIKVTHCSNYPGCVTVPTLVESLAVQNKTL